MRIPNTPKSSFGIPQEMQEQVEKLRTSKKEREEEPQSDVEEDWPMNDKPKAGTEESKDDNVLDPYEILKRIGIEPKEEDFHSLIFRGFVEKTVPVAKNPMNGQTLTAKIKTLTAEELDLVDEMVAESLESTKMTNAGLDVRRTMLVVSLAVLELNDKPLFKPIYKDDKTVDIKATAAAKRQVLSKLSPYVIDTITRVHAQMSSCYNLIITDPESKIVKKS